MEMAALIFAGLTVPDWVEISIIDNGPGIAPELHNKIFELNFSGRAGAHPGKLGFGLWWVKTLMTRLGGSVVVESDGQHGTTFILRPAARGEIIMTAQVLRALVVEDDHSWQQILSEILSDCGLEVDVAGSLDEASLSLKIQPHRLAVVDLSLSPNDHNNYDGLRVLDAVRRLDPNCRTILLTGFATVELAVTALTDYGAFTFLRKESFHRSQFRDIVYRILVSPPQLATPLPASGTAASSSAAKGQITPQKTSERKSFGCGR